MFTPKNILLVEDNMDDELLTIRALKKHDPSFEIHVARDGVEALDYLFEKSRENIKDISILPKLIILDLQLPKMGGIEVLRRIKTNPATAMIPVVVLTSSNENEDILKSYGFGANSFIRKPVDYLKFLEVAGNIGLYWLAVNESPVEILKSIQR